ncbi:MAG: 2-oxoglutarate dehydrogenase E1 component [Chromatiales bacterium]|jgi:2-oxoglutarate dehydrogenase E1 component|nr:2-oxoglutarate dehydrogenase E1 component [Chromatiales bacterium]
MSQSKPRPAPRSLGQSYATSPLFGANAPYLEELYERFLKDPASVPARWREFFAETQAANPAPATLGSGRPATQLAAVGGGRTPAPPTEKQAAVSRLMQVYHLRGHQIADIDPLGLLERPQPIVMGLDYHGLDESDLDTSFYVGNLGGQQDVRMPLRDIIATLRQVYCGKIGADFAHLSRGRERVWIRERLERGMLTDPFTAEERRHILRQLTAAEGIERYLHTRYVGQKRFSLEGGDSLIPLLDDLIQQGGTAGFQEMVIGMAHRGRINVLINVLGKAPGVLFSEFEGAYDPAKHKGSGDVKYHMGFSADVRTPGGNVHVVLAFNPSHLEIVNPVVEGSVRARQDRRADEQGDAVLPILIHGDAAFACQGVVAETFQLSQARGFRTGGTVHIVVNNQVGFTTSDPQDARSTPYASDIARMVEAPVFHVNGDDPEAVVFVTRLALEYRRTFHKDVVIDLVCYRRHGHNEADEPAATQPRMYQVIRKHPTTRQLYASRLVEAGVIEATEAERLNEDYRTRLDAGDPLPNTVLGNIGNEFTVDWSRYLKGDWEEVERSALDAAQVPELAREINRVPAGFNLHPRVAKIVTDRERMAAGEIPMDWGFAELMAYASLIKAGYKVRITGQDSRRGTFFHRHATLHDQVSGERYTALTDLPGSARNAFTVTDSLLSEEAVLGFEYGYSTTDPDSLVIWEAQFGDFANGAQVVIDQFISSGEAKWGRLCGMTLFLPHGQEGQGPEHSSARLERFLQLCAELNMQVCVPSTPAQMFHMLRRQMLRSLRKPLVVLTPKSLLRHRLSSSPVSELVTGRFQTLIPEIEPLDAAAVNRVVFCSGKVYFDLLEARRAGAGNGRAPVPLIRVEQLYPFPANEYAAVLARYPNAKEIVWCQEEPQNQGAWYQIRHQLQRPLGGGQQLFYAGRRGAAAPAPGIFQLHVEQQQGLVNAALFGEYN